MHNFETVIETDRLILRPFTMDDVEASYQLNLDPEVTRYTNDGGVKTRKEIHKIIESVVHGDYEKYGFGRFAVVDKASNQFIGFSGLKYLPECDYVDIGYRFKSSFWGKGIATETVIPSLAFGFNTLKLDKIYGLALPENSASIRILEKTGFIYDTSVIYFGVSANQYFLEEIRYREQFG